MPTVHVMGYVEPKEVHLYMEGLTPIVWQDIHTHEKFSYLVTVLDCIVSVECEVDTFHDNDEFISQMNNRAADVARLAVDLVAFKRGIGLTVYLNELIDPDGKGHRLISHTGGVTRCSSYDESGIGEIFKLLSWEPAIGESLNDLILAMTAPHHAPVNCGRAVEGIRRLIDANPDKKAAWNTMQNVLNLSHNYVLYVYNLSLAPRHGDRTFLPTPEQEESIKRSWEIMDRFIHYRKRQNQPLPLSEFPLLP